MFFKILLSDMPVAERITLSLVEVSPSTEIELKVSSLISSRSFCKIGLEILISVEINANMVAIFGAIIPEPLAIPVICIFEPSKL